MATSKGKKGPEGPLARLPVMPPGTPPPGSPTPATAVPLPVEIDEPDEQEVQEPDAEEEPAVKNGEQAEQDAEGQEVHAVTLTADDEQVIGVVEAKWTAHRKKGLELRYDTGSVFNAKYGPPSEKQPKGLAVMKELSKRLGINLSDLSRMRNFAHLFASFDEFRTKHPEVTTWSEVKEDVLPRAETHEAVKKARKTMARVKYLFGLLDEVQTTLPDVDLDELRRKDFKKLDETVRTIVSRFGTTSDSSTPFLSRLAQQLGNQSPPAPQPPAHPE
jgi:hypothetical protein